MKSKMWKHNNMLREARLKEKYTREDGIYILACGHVSGVTGYYIEVWKNGEVIEKTGNFNAYYGGPKPEDTTWEEAEKLQEKYPDLEIIDGTGATYYHFSGDYARQSYKVDDFTSKGAKYHDYSDQEIKNMDERPIQTIKWAYLVKPGVIKIGTRSVKNPRLLWDTEANRYITGYGTTKKQIADMSEFINNDPNSYEGTWEDIKDEDNYMIIVYDRLYYATKQERLLNNIIKAGLYIDGDKIKSEREILTGRVTRAENFYDEDIVETISFDMNFDTVEKLSYYDTKNTVLNNFQALIDCLLLLGKDFSKEIQISDTDKYGSNNVKEDFYILHCDENYRIYITTNSQQRKAENVKAGDIIIKEPIAHYYYYRTFYYVLSVKNNIAQTVDITKEIPSPYGSSDYLIDLNLLNAYKHGNNFVGVSNMRKINRINLIKDYNQPYYEWKKISSDSPEELKRYLR